MARRSWLTWGGLVLLTLSLSAGCSDDDEGGLSEAQQHGVGAACSNDDDCFIDDQKLKCLDFKGGYCGLEDCTGDADCPSGSACVAHDDGNNYCFLVCIEKLECNATRPAEIEANCSSNAELVDNDRNDKTCVPPS